MKTEPKLLPLLPNMGYLASKGGGLKHLWPPFDAFINFKRQIFDTRY